MKTEKILETIWITENYRKQRYYYTIRIFLCMFVITMLSIFGTIQIVMKPTIYRYIMVNTSGRLVVDKPLTDPALDDKQIKEWTIDAITTLYTFNFNNFRTQFQQAQRNLTPVGWAEFEKALRESGNFEAVTGNSFVVTSAPKGPAEIISQGIFKDNRGDSRYGWIVEFPMTAVYRNSKNNNTSQDLLVIATIIRVPSWVNTTGISLRQIIFK